ncbi:MAG: hypothetical protein HQ462_04025 [Deltaproteobacteria bacterium]|nr:hypothetical protein [Deltaproteobacteria bacterium]
MLKTKYLSFEFTIALLMICFCSSDSFGYIDPSSGYILWQVLFGAVVGILFFAKRIWSFLKNFFTASKPTDSSTS